MVPRLGCRVPEADLGLVDAGIVQAAGADYEEVRHGRKGQVDRRAAFRAEGAALDGAAIADEVPGPGLAL